MIIAENLRRLVADIFANCGCSEAEAARIAHYLVLANLTGHDSHGVIRVPRYVTALAEGRVIAGREITIVTENDALAVVDGNRGFGQTVGPQATRLGIAKAKAKGAAIIALRHAGHLGRIGDFAEMAAKDGIVSIHLVNVAGSLLVAPFGGVERRISTAPLAIGVPQPDAPPLILVFATSVVAEGKALVAHRGGKPVPDDAMIGPDGAVSGDTRLLYGETRPGDQPDYRQGSGALRAMGGHKGSGLAFMIELLAGALTGSGTAGPPPRTIANGMLSVFLDQATFDTEDGFVAEMRQYADYVTSARPAEEDGEVLLPGDIERRTLAQRSADGIPLSDEAWQAIKACAHSVGVDTLDT